MGCRGAGRSGWTLNAVSGLRASHACARRAGHVQADPEGKGAEDRSCERTDGRAVGMGEDGVRPTSELCGLVHARQDRGVPADLPHRLAVRGARAGPAWRTVGRVGGSTPRPAGYRPRDWARGGVMIPPLPDYVSRTCLECGCAEVDVCTQNARDTMRCPECRARFCPYCRVRMATRRWVPLGCAGTQYHVSVCATCLPDLITQDRRPA
jgi:hypothetical protein